MAYSSSLTDAEGAMLEPLLPQILPQQKHTRPCAWTKRESIDGLLYQLKHGCHWEDLPTDFPPYSTVDWHDKQWRAAGAIETLMHTLHAQVHA